MFFENNNVEILTRDATFNFQDINGFDFYSTKKELILLLCENTIDSLSAYVSGLNSGHAVMLLPASLESTLLDSIIQFYEPKWIIGLGSFKGYNKDQQGLLCRIEPTTITIHPDLAILLSTSGTTGSKKFVRLSYNNIKSNALSIINYLEIQPMDRAMLNLPLSYSYGMSIVNSHLMAGASIIITEDSVLEKRFWELVKEKKATSMTGVPFTYQMLHRIGFTKMDLPHLKVLTQAGGRLSTKLINYFGEYALKNNKRFYVMYGQTEAAPRISYVPYDKVLEKAGSIGIAIPGGELSIVNNELVYKGPNVMMGYAEVLNDLTKGDECNGILYTGDTAIVDRDGYFTITGRMKRFIKLVGLRINLDDIEKKLEDLTKIPIACTGTDEKLMIAIEDESCIEEISNAIEKIYKLHRTNYKIKVLNIPRFSNGKIDYVKLKEQCL